MDLDYLSVVSWRKSPRIDGILKTSQKTKDLVCAWIAAQKSDVMDEILIEIIESRCGFENFTAAAAIAYGFDDFMRHRIYCCLSRLVRFKKIERQGRKGRYAYRLLPKAQRSEEVRAKSSAARKKSVLGVIAQAKAARRYA